MIELKSQKYLLFTGFSEVGPDFVESVDVALEGRVTVRRRRLRLAQPFRDHVPHRRQGPVRVAG